MNNTRPNDPYPHLADLWKWVLGLFIALTAIIVTQSSIQTLDSSVSVPVGDLSITYTNLCDGSIDTVNGQTPAAERISASHQLDIRGWLAISTAAGTVPAHKLLSLRGEAGDWIFREARTVERSDVGAQFGNTGLSAAGVESTSEISGLQGHYDIGLAYREKNSVVVCRKFSVPLNLAKDDSPKVLTEVAPSEQPALPCDGSVDLVDGSPPNVSISTSGNQLNVSGWLVVKTPGGSLPDLTYVVVQSRDGRMLFAETTPKDRPDVGQHFDNSRLTSSGYEVTIDLTPLEGEYVFGLAYRMNDEARICGEFAIPLSVRRSVSSQ